MSAPPTRADRKVLKGIEKLTEGFLRRRFQDEGKQAPAAFELILPDSMAGVTFQRREQDIVDQRMTLQPERDF
ncbi:hypothetical protein D3C85_1854990 [compost metagenome]